MIAGKPRLGKYELLETIGRGGYGTVYRARYTVLNVERAVKVLHPQLANDPEFIERFRREARLAAQLEHAHIVPVYDLDEVQGSYFLAMKYMAGGSLKDLLERVNPLPFERALEVARQVASALDYAHSHGLVHRDVKPGNILFEAGDPATQAVARLGDFGFARAIQGTSSASFSFSGGILGTPAYMAPEAWERREPAPTMDVYSLACVFFEMVCGQSLFAGQSPMEIIRRHALEELTVPEQWPQEVPAGMMAVFRKALAKDPQQRYPTADEFACAVQQLLVAAQERRAAEENARRAAEEQARREAEEQARRAAEELARKAAVEQARRETEEKLRREAAEHARQEAEERNRRAAAEQAQREAQEKAHREAEEKARLAAVEQARRETEKKMQHEAEERSLRKAQARQQKEAEAKASQEADQKKRLAAVEQPGRATRASTPWQRRWYVWGGGVILVLALIALCWSGYTFGIGLLRKTTTPTQTLTPSQTLPAIQSTSQPGLTMTASPTATATTTITPENTPTPSMTIFLTFTQTQTVTSTSTMTSAPLPRATIIPVPSSPTSTPTKKRHPSPTTPPLPTSSPAPP
jgi:tRNA A-37 threonylcarbamoyl transferase component Bud32